MLWGEGGGGAWLADCFLVVWVMDGGVLGEGVVVRIGEGVLGGEVELKWKQNAGHNKKRKRSNLSHKNPENIHTSFSPTNTPIFLPLTTTLATSPNNTPSPLSLPFTFPFSPFPFPPSPPLNTTLNPSISSALRPPGFIFPNSVRRCSCARWIAAL